MSTSFRVTLVTYQAALGKLKPATSELIVRPQPESFKQCYETLRAELGKHTAIEVKVVRNQSRETTLLVLTIWISRKHIKSFLHTHSPQLLEAMQDDGWL